MSMVSVKTAIGCWLFVMCGAAWDYSAGSIDGNTLARVAVSLFFLAVIVVLLVEGVALLINKVFK